MLCRVILFLLVLVPTKGESDLLKIHEWKSL